MKSDHAGPAVVSGDGGTARFAKQVFAAFDRDRARATLEFVDGFYRAPANRGYEAVLDRLEADLRAAGYGSKPGFELEVLTHELEAEQWSSGARGPALAWTPLQAKLAWVDATGAESVLHQFAAPADRDRVMLPINSPSADVVGRIASNLDGLESGMLLVTDAPPARDLLRRAHDVGALAVLSSCLSPYNVDPSGNHAERDALQFCSVPYGTPIPVAMISSASRGKILAALAANPDAKLSLHAEVAFEQRPVRTLVARIVGKSAPNEAVAVASHVQEPGACDNASGVAGLAESAVDLVAAIESGRVVRPARTVVFLWGDEYRQSSSWLDSTKLSPVAGLSSDMTGESRQKTGAIALLERMPDPGAITALPPDKHTGWGLTEFDHSALAPNGVALVARSAIFDVAALDDSGWATAENPYEGGSDHDEFIKRGIPSALFWHFTDFTYHTSLDRLEYVDVDEMRRTGSALVATALALADPQPADLTRYLASLNAELDVRLKACAEAKDEALAQSWRDWCNGARHWLRGECLHLPHDQR